MLYIQFVLFLEKSQNIDFKDYSVDHTFIINDKHRRYERISSIPDLILVSFIQASHFTHLHALMYFLLFFTFSFAWKEKLINSAKFSLLLSNFVIVFEIILEQGNKKDSLQTLKERRLQFSFFYLLVCL